MSTTATTHANTWPTTVRNAMRDQRLTIQQLVDDVGSNRETVGSWLSGRHPNISAATAERIAERLGLTLTAPGAVPTNP